MSTATLHQPVHTKSSTKPKASRSTGAIDPTDRRPETGDDGTRLLLALAGAATLIILVFFLAMMWWLSGYGPTTA